MEHREHLSHHPRDRNGHELLRQRDSEQNG